MNTNEVLIIDNCSLAIFKYRRMDAAYITVDFLFCSERCNGATISIHTHKIDRTRLFRKDIKHLQSFSEFQQHYPEYFI